MSVPVELSCTHCCVQQLVSALQQGPACRDILVALCALLRCTPSAVCDVTPSCVCTRLGTALAPGLHDPGCCSLLAAHVAPPASGPLQHTRWQVMLTSMCDGSLTAFGLVSFSTAVCPSVADTLGKCPTVALDVGFCTCPTGHDSAMLVYTSRFLPQARQALFYKPHGQHPTSPTITAFCMLNLPKEASRPLHSCNMHQPEQPFHMHAATNAGTQGRAHMHGLGGRAQTPGPHDGARALPAHLQPEGLPVQELLLRCHLRPPPAQQLYVLQRGSQICHRLVLLQGRVSQGEGSSRAFDGPSTQPWGMLN